MVQSNHFAIEPVYDGYYCSMVSVMDLLGTLRESLGEDHLKVAARRMLHQARSDTIVILDDIGAERPSNWVKEQLYALIDLRYRRKRSTFITTNCTLNFHFKKQKSNVIVIAVQQCPKNS